MWWSFELRVTVKEPASPNTRVCFLSAGGCPRAGLSPGVENLPTKPTKPTTPTKPTLTMADDDEITVVTGGASESFAIENCTTSCARSSRLRKVSSPSGETRQMPLLAIISSRSDKKPRKSPCKRGVRVCSWLRE